MTPNHGQLRLIRSDGTEIIGTWSVINSSYDIKVRLGDRDYSIACGLDLRAQVDRFVRVLESDVFNEDLALVACVNCRHFQVSGMGLDMAHGTIGNCTLHKMGVRALFVCDDFTSKEA